MNRPSNQARRLNLTPEPPKKHEDRIVYQVVSKPGGVDGRSQDAGGRVLFASYHRAEAEEKVSGHSILEMKALDVAQVRRDALAKLNPLDRLVLGLL